MQRDFDHSCHYMSRHEKFQGVVCLSRSNATGWLCETHDRDKPTCTLASSSSAWVFCKTRQSFELGKSLIINGMEQQDPFECQLQVLSGSGATATFDNMRLLYDVAFPSFRLRHGKCEYVCDDASDLGSRPSWDYPRIRSLPPGKVLLFVVMSLLGGELKFTTFELHILM